MAATHTNTTTTIELMEEGNAARNANNTDIMTTVAMEKQALAECLYNAWMGAYDEHSSLNECMIMDVVKDKDKLLNSYMISNNPSPYTDSYYPQYHVVDFIAFNVHAKKAFECIKTYLTYNHKLEKKYSRHYGFKLTKRRTCVNSYSTTIELIFTYPRKQQRYSESPDLKKTQNSAITVYSFLQTSGLSDKCRTDWSDVITACKPYDYVSKSEFLKLLNTHSGGCFASEQEYTRFRAFVDEWKEYCVVGGDSGAVGAEEDDESTTTLRRSSGNDDVSIATRRVFSPPHPSIGLRRSSSKPSSSSPDCCSSHVDGAVKANDDSNVKPSSMLYADGEKSAGAVSDEYNDDAKQKKDHKYALTTGFMQHAVCGLHKVTIVAKDIHKNTNTLMFHKREYDSRRDTNIIKSQDYMLTHNPGKDPCAKTPTSKKRKNPPAKRKGTTINASKKVKNTITNKRATHKPPKKKIKTVIKNEQDVEEEDSSSDGSNSSTHSTSTDDDELEQ